MDVRQTLWRMGYLFWKLHAGQLVIEQAFLQTKGKLFVGDCSRQLGKSTWAVVKCLEKALQMPGARIKVATAFLTDLEQFILPAFDFVMGDMPEDIKPKFHTQKTEYRFPNGSRIQLMGLDRKPDGLRGNKIHLIILDEAGFISRLKYLYQSVIVPATTHVKDAKVIMISTQPESPDHDFIAFCDKAAESNSYVCLDVYKNPLLTSSQINDIATECGGKTSTAFRREYLCERIVEEGRALFPEFKLFHVKQSPVSKMHGFWHKLEALDSGVRDQTACIFGYYDFERAKAVIEGEFTLQGHEVTTRRIYENVSLVEKSLDYTSVYRRIADNDNLILVQDLGTEFGLHFTPTDKDSLAAMVNKVRLWLGQDRIEIHPRCVKLISALKAGIWDKQRKEFARSATHGHFDILSALVYFIRNIPEQENPIPHMWGVDLSNKIVRDRHEPSELARDLKKAFGV